MVVLIHAKEIERTGALTAALVDALKTDGKPAAEGALP